MKAPETPPVGTSLVSLELNDYGNAKAFEALYGDSFRYRLQKKVWHQWTGHHWAEVSESVVFRAMVTTVDMRHSAIPKPTGEAERFFKISKNINKLRAALEIAKLLSTIEWPPDTVLDADPLLLGCKNGTVELRTGMLRNGLRSELVTFSTNIEYDPRATCPRFDRFLHEIFAGDLGLIEFVQRAVGYTLTGLTKEQVLFLLLGEGANGKSVFLNIIEKLFGELASATAFKTFTETKGDRIPNDLAMLQALRLVTSSEINEHARLEESRIKAITGGDSVSARYLYGEWFTYRPRYKIWVAVNHLPIIQGTDKGIWRRLLVVPFQTSFSHSPERDLEAKLLAELPGILRWAIEGCLAWQASGLKIPVAVRRASRQYRQRSDSIEMFAGERLERVFGISIQARVLFVEYRRWCKKSGLDSATEQSFGRRMTKLGYERCKTRSANYYANIRMKP